MMPRRDGFSLLEALRADPGTDFVPIVLLTTRAEAEDRLAGLGLGADDYLTKPFDARELVARVDNLIEQRQRLRERFAGVGGSDAPVVLHPAPVEVESVDAEFLESVRLAIEAHLGDEDFGEEDFVRDLEMGSYVCWRPHASLRSARRGLGRRSD